MLPARSKRFLRAEQHPEGEQAAAEKVRRRGVPQLGRNVQRERHHQPLWSGGNAAAVPVPAVQDDRRDGHDQSGGLQVRGWMW